MKDFGTFYGSASVPKYILVAGRYTAAFNNIFDPLRYF